MDRATSFPGDEAANSAAEAAATVAAAISADTPEDDPEELSLHDAYIKGAWTDASFPEELQGVEIAFFKRMVRTWTGLTAVMDILARDSAARAEVAENDAYTYKSPIDAGNMRCAQYVLADSLSGLMEGFQEVEFWKKLRGNLMLTRFE